MKVVLKQDVKGLGKKVSLLMLQTAMPETSFFLRILQLRPMLRI